MSWQNQLMFCFSRISIAFQLGTMLSHRDPPPNTRWRSRRRAPSSTSPPCCLLLPRHRTASTSPRVSKSRSTTTKPLRAFTHTSTRTFCMRPPSTSAGTLSRCSSHSCWPRLRKCSLKRLWQRKRSRCWFRNWRLRWPGVTRQRSKP